MEAASLLYAFLRVMACVAAADGNHPRSALASAYDIGQGYKATSSPKRCKVADDPQIICRKLTATRTAYQDLGSTAAIGLGPTTIPAEDLYRNSIACIHVARQPAY